MDIRIGNIANKAEYLAARQGILHGNRRVSRPCHAHRLVYITSSGKRIPDRAAQTGSGSAERLYLRRMIMGLILEENQPFLGFLSVSVIHLHRHHHGTGVNFIGFLHVLQPAFFFQFPHCHQRQIHQTDKFILPVPEDLFPCIQITAISSL